MGSAKKQILLGLGVLAALSAEAHVRQRSFFQADDSDVSKGGVETILHWESSVPVRMHSFSGCAGTGATTSSISFDGTDGCGAGDARQMVGDSIAQWFADSPLNVDLAVLPSLNLTLNSGLPITTTSGCETTASGGADGINNILFTTKINTACASSIEDYTGVIGLTRVRYALNTGQIVEADIQLNDPNYLFVESGASGLPEVNLPDVLTHELGHFWGLDHSSSRESTMLFALSEGMATTSYDDALGVWSLYQNSSSSLGRLKGSLTANGTKVFGAAVFALDARTLEVVATEMTNLDGVFEFCGLPEGNYIAYANAYRPASTNIHEYYSGFLGTTANDNGLCANPGCKRMNSSITYSLFSKSNEGGSTAGETMKIFSVSGNTTNQYLNLTASTSEPSLTLASGVEALDLDSPRVMKFQSADLTPTQSGVIAGDNQFEVTTTASGDLNIKIAALGLYSRLDIEVDIATSDAPGVSLKGSCSEVVSVVDQGSDFALENCSLAGNTDHIITVTASAVSCADIPGNVDGCDSTGDELASTSLPLYMINVYDPGSSEVGLADTSLSSVTLGSSAYSNLPSCSSYKYTIEEQEEAACCGSIGGGGIDPGSSLWLAILMSPLSWVLLMLFGYRLNARFNARSKPLL